MNHVAAVSGLNKGIARSVLTATVFIAMLWCFAPATHAAGDLAEFCRNVRPAHGLCALIGVTAGSPVNAAVVLAEKGNILVHGVAFSEEEAAKARVQIREAGVDGLVSIEHLVLAPMPYRNNLISMMVVSDFDAAVKNGFTKAEAIRCIAPYGKLCTFENGTWHTTDVPMPSGMDEWTHNIHGPDGNRASNDTVVGFPVGYRWHAGLPFNINNRERQGNRYSATRGLAIAGGRCFTFSDSEIENLRGAYFLGQDMDQYITARDAFNGLFLWRRKIGRTYYGGLWYMNLAPFIATDAAVYTASEEGKLLVMDAATGADIRRLATAFPPGEILLDQGILVSAGWKGGTWLGESKVNRYERRHMHSAVPEGVVEAFDVESGNKLWSIPQLATSIRSSEGRLFMVCRAGADLYEENLRYKPKNVPKPEQVAPGGRPGQKVVAIDLKTGKPLWEKAGADFAGEGYEVEDLRLDAVGLGVVTVVHAPDTRTSKVSVLSARAGDLILQKKTGSFPVLQRNAIHLAGKKYSPETGKEIGSSTTSIGGTVCTPSYVVGDIVVRNRGGGFSVDGKPTTYAGARGACGVASAPAYGSFYTPQNWCTCCPPQISGFISFGPVSGIPSPDQLKATNEVVRGPAFSEPLPETVPSTSWPMFRNNDFRNSATALATPKTLDILWTCKLVTPHQEGLVPFNWKEYLNDPLTAPTVSGGLIATALMDANRVEGIRLENGKSLWSFSVGSRIESSPTLYRGTCLFGAHDGFVYSLNAETGNLRWRLRMAPNDERMVSYGRVESPWPVVGSVLVSGDVAYASAGRTQGSDGGILIRAFSPVTGEIFWSSVIPPEGGIREMRRNDIILKNHDSLQLMVKRFDPQTGKPVTNPTRETNVYYEKLSRLKRTLDTFKQQLEAAGGTSSYHEKRIEQTEKQLAELVKPESEIAPFLGSNGTGSEGYMNWNWPKLGYRKYRQMNYGNISGTLVSWDENAVCSMLYERRIRLYAMENVGQARERLEARPKWEISLPDNYQVTSLVLCKDGIVVGGGIYNTEAGKPHQGYVAVLARDTGARVVEKTFDSPVGFGSVAVIPEGICVALADGTVSLVGAR